MSTEEALKLLKEYSCLQIKTVESETQKEQLRQALLLITRLSDYENIGICADNLEQGLNTLAQYLKALGYNANFNTVADTFGQGVVYIKFNTQKMAHYLDVYTGTYRGVLISCQSENEALAGTYGYFPLDLFS